MKRLAFTYASLLVSVLTAQIGSHSWAQVPEPGLHEGSDCHSDNDCNPGLVCRGPWDARGCVNRKCSSNGDCGSQAFCGADAYGQICITSSEFPPLEPSAAAGNSGIYGSSFSEVAGGAPQPFPTRHDHSGKCVTVRKVPTRQVVAVGNCDRDGRFRVVVRPGRYVIDGVGGSKEEEVRPGRWQRVDLVKVLEVP